MSTPVLMFMNMKGGVGKTTLSVEVSRTLAHEYDKDVLLIDYDPQSNASLALLPSRVYFRIKGDGRSIAEILLPGTDETNPFSVVGTVKAPEIDASDFTQKVRGWRYPSAPHRKAGSLHLLPGDLDLMRLALSVPSDEHEAMLLARWNALIASACDNYECIVIDCHPAGSFFTKSALLSSDAVIIPVTSDAYAATGLGMMLDHMTTWQQSGGAKDFLIAFNDANNQWDTDVEDIIRTDNKFAAHCLPTRVAYSRLYRNLASRHQTAAEQPVAYKRKAGSTISRLTREIVTELLRRSIFDPSWR